MGLDAIELTRRLVGIDSTTYHEGLVGEFLHEFLVGLGWTVERMAVAQPELALTPGGGTGDRFNLYASMAGVTPEVVLSTHMDTVPPFFGCTEDAEYVYGRGRAMRRGLWRRRWRRRTGCGTRG